MLPDFLKLSPDNGPARYCFDSDETNAPFGKIKHLQRARVSNELLDIARHQLFGADDDVDGYRP